MRLKSVKPICAAIAPPPSIPNDEAMTGIVGRND